MMLRGDWISPAVPYRLASGCVTKATPGSSDFSPDWASLYGESKFVNMTVRHRIQSRFTEFPRNNLDQIEEALTARWF
jgi:hypothetical protein